MLGERAARDALRFAAAFAFRFSSRISAVFRSPVRKIKRSKRQSTLSVAFQNIRNPSRAQTPVSQFCDCPSDAAARLEAREFGQVRGLHLRLHRIRTFIKTGLGTRPTDPRHLEKFPKVQRFALEKSKDSLRKSDKVYVYTRLFSTRSIHTLSREQPRVTLVSPTLKTQRNPHRKTPRPRRRHVRRGLRRRREKKKVR